MPADFTVDEKRWASRGGLKLEAALRTFGLRARVENAACIDVGASTGGFTDVLLGFGAQKVTALDVGHGQMVDRLRSDPRVEVLEKTHIKTASLSVAPGPYAFFVVDVSFLAARTVLKPLSKRLLAGAEGVVLVKPQFELPDALIPRGGVIESRNLRKLAFNRFKKKALERGFTILGRVDSPVHGGDGNVEILTWLRFDGLPTTDAGDDD